MSAFAKLADIADAEVPYTSVGEYLMLETQSPFRHEYVDGIMYAMAGGKKAHHILERNLVAMLYNRLKGKRCSSTTSNMKLRVTARGGDEVNFYYPDSMIFCDSSDGGETDGHAWIERPSVIFEIISSSTRRVDEGRKRKAYLSVLALDAYVRIEQDRAEAIVERRTAGEWVVDRVSGLDSIIRLPSVEVELPMAELYEDVQFPAGVQR